MRELLFSITKKDFDVNWFSGKGAGGQHRNKHQNCVRLKHRDSGVIVTGQNSRSRKENIKAALQNLVNHPKFKIWHTRKVNEELGVFDKVDGMMKDIKIEVIKNGMWVEVK